MNSGVSPCVSYDRSGVGTEARQGTDRSLPNLPQAREDEDSNGKHKQPDV